MFRSRTNLAVSNPWHSDGSGRRADSVAQLDGSMVPMVERARHAVPLLRIGVRQFSLSKWRSQ